MIKTLLALLLFAATDTYALGPIPNGNYLGTKSCTGENPQQSQLIVTDNSMDWDGQKNEFLVDPNGFFKLNGVTGVRGSGLGHFTDDGIHYEAVFEIPIGNGETFLSHGFDTFISRGGKVYLDSAASMGDLGSVKCTAEYTKI